MSRYLNEEAVWSAVEQITQDDSIGIGVIEWRVIVNIWQEK